MAQIAKLSASLLLASALPAAALDFGNGFYLNGDVELEYLTAGGDSSTFGFTDLTLGWRSQGSGGLTFGFDVTNVSFHDLDSNFDLNTQWFSLAIGTSYGEFAVGRPRPLHDTMFDTPDVGGSRLLGLETFFIGESFVSLFALSEGSDIDIYGVTFSGQSGDLSYGAGIHQLSEGGTTANVFELVGKYQIGAAEVYGGLEFGDGELDEFSKVLIGTSYSGDRYKVGAQYTAIDLFGGNGSLLKIFGEYAVLENLTVGAQYETFDLGGPSLDIFGLSGTYTTGTGGFAELGVASLDGAFGGDDTLTTASIGFKF